ncbi:MAG: uroporphyrinogen decarboxylase family protein [Nitrososphaeria archaeon]|jgi:uroporphyrinogen decarboxylase
MNHRERFFAALDLKEPDCVPITDLGPDPPIVEAILGKKLGTVLNMAGGSDSWQSSIDYRLSMFEACKKIDFDAVAAMSDYSLTTKDYKPKFIDEKRYIDHWGRIMQTDQRSKTTYFVGGTINSPEDLDNYEPPDPFHPDVVEMMQKTIRRIRGEDIVITAQCHSGWHMAFQVRGGIDKLSIDFYKNPSFARKLFDKISKTCQGFAKSLIEAGTDVLFVTDDYADNKGPMMNPRLFREYELPKLKEIVNIAKKHGIPLMKHSDGNLYPILDDIVNTGITGLHPIEPGAMSLKDVKERYGSRICLAGNVDCRNVLPFGNEEAVRKDVRRCIDEAAKGGGYVLTSSNSLHANVKVENIYTMVDEARKYGKYPLHKS